MHWDAAVWRRLFFASFVKLPTDGGHLPVRFPIFPKRNLGFLVVPGREIW